MELVLLSRIGHRVLDTAGAPCPEESASPGDPSSADSREFTCRATHADPGVSTSFQIISFCDNELFCCSFSYGFANADARRMANGCFVWDQM